MLADAGVDVVVVVVVAKMVTINLRKWMNLPRVGAAEGWRGKMRKPPESPFPEAENSC